jgi:hypothetical protein
MPRPYASAVIPAPVTQVWNVVRDFNGLAGWHPAIEASSLDSGSSGAELGAVRRLTVAGGGVVVERLLRRGVRRRAGGAAGAVLLRSTASHHRVGACTAATVPRTLATCW